MTSRLTPSVYVLVNLAVWSIWVVIGTTSHSWWPWPVFMTVFWGIGLLMNGWEAYGRRPITEQERAARCHAAGSISVWTFSPRI